MATTVPVKDDVARTFLTRVEWEEGEDKAGPGMSGQAEFDLRTPGSVVQVSRDAVVRFPDGGAKVWVLVEENGRTLVQAKDVVLGDSLGEKVHVISGLEAGARVVVRGNEISGSCWRSPFFVEGEAAISVPSTIVPPRNSSPFA